MKKVRICKPTAFNGKPAMISQVFVNMYYMWSRTAQFEDGSFQINGRLCPLSQTFNGTGDDAPAFSMHRDHWGL